MKVGSGTKKVAGMSDAAVQAKTGKTWREWLVTLDKVGANKMNHRDITRLVHARFPKIGGWWAQMVTVGYEQARGLREKHQTPEGYAVSASATIAAPVGTLFRAWLDAAVRRRWLAHPTLTIRKASRNKSLRITWGDGKTHVDVLFYPKGAGKTQVNAQHRKLADSRQASKMKSYWKEQLANLKALVEGKR